MRMRLNVAVSAAVASFAAAAHADFVVPDAWTPGDAGSTAQVWDDFTGVTVTNLPDALDVNPNGTALAGDANAPANGAFLTSSANIYAPAGPGAPTAVVPGFGPGAGDFTTVVAQVNILGLGLDPETAALSDGTTTFAPDDAVLFESTPFGGFGTDDTWFFQFSVPGSAAEYEFSVASGLANVSLGALRVDTFTSSEPTLATAPPAVPEPALGMVGLVAGSLVLRRRR